MVLGKEAPKIIDMLNFGKAGRKRERQKMANNYYPFGLTFNSYLRVTASPNDYLFNGKEKQAEWGVYDFHARMYDPALGRWWVIDPLSEVQEEFSPYHFSYNNRSFTMILLG